MKKQMIQFGVIIGILVVLIGGYFGISKYFSDKEAKEQENKIVAFELKDDKKITGISYMNEGDTISLGKTEEKWYDVDDTSIDLNANTIETSMLAQLVEIDASRKIEKPEDISEYGFSNNENGEKDASTNKIVMMDEDNNTNTLYIGDANPYDSQTYYMMVEGDDNVYLIDSTVVDAFSMSIDNLTEEETTLEESVTE